jgi:hypothetical protein
LTQTFSSLLVLAILPWLDGSLTGWSMVQLGLVLLITTAVVTYQPRAVTA